MLNSTAPSPGVPIWPVRMTGRALNTFGVASLAVSLAILICLSFSVLPRTGVGVASAAALILAGAVVTRTGFNQAWWFGTSLTAAGYVLAAFFAHSTYYISGMTGLETPYLSWVLELCLAATLTLHGTRNSLLRFLAVPFTLLASVHVLSHGLTDPATILGISVPAVVSILSVLWFAGLSALYQKMEETTEDGSTLEERATGLLYKIGQEFYFVLAAVSALALPNFVSSMEYAPLWWAAEMPLLLAISWRSKTFLKHTLVMGIWGLSAALLLLTNIDLSPVVLMAVPVSGLAMALTYRYAKSTWKDEQKQIGYGVYLYGSLALAAAVPLLKMGLWEATPYLLVEAGIMLSLALVLRDRLTQLVALVASLAAAVMFAAQWQSWDLVTVIPVVIGAYTFSLLYGRLVAKGGLPDANFMRLWRSTRTHAITAKEAGWLEIGYSLIGFASLMAGSYLLVHTPFNTVAWGIESLSLIIFGFLSHKKGHRACGLAAWGIASMKLVFADLSGAATLMRTLIAFGAFGIFSIASGHFYLREYALVNRRKPEDEETPPENKDEPKDGDNPPNNGEGQ